MRFHPVLPGLTTLALAVALLCAAGTLAPASAARSNRADERKGDRATATSATARRDSVAVTRSAADENALRLGRAAIEWRRGDLRAVVENLEAIDFATEPQWVEADRAAFILGQAFLRLGATQSFLSLTQGVSSWHRQSVYTRWLAAQRRLLESETAPAASRDSTNADADSAAPPDTLSGAIPSADVEPWLADADTTTALGRDLAGADAVRLATEALVRGEDPTALLATVPRGSRYASRARHMLGLAAIERGDSTQGVAILEALANDDSSYSARREVLLALAGRSLEQGRWEDAHRIYREIDQDWSENRDTLRSTLRDGAYDPLWRSWETDAALSGAVILDGAAADTLAAGFATVSTDLSTRPSLDPPFPTSPSPAPGMRWPVAPPPPEDRRAIAESGRALGEAGYQAERTRWAIAREREDLSALQGYLGNGLERARREAAELEAHATLLDSLNRTLDAIDARLRSVRDEATRRILTRSAKLLRGCADDLLWLGAMRLYHIEGPNRGREDVPPAGMHTPETVVIQEEMLVRSIHDMVEIMVKDAPSIIARSYERRWRPGMIERAAAQDSAAHRALAWARGLSTSIDSSIAAAGSSDSLRWLEARLATLTRRADSLGTAHQALRAAVARRAVEHALAALEGEREGIDYGLAASAYGRSVGLGALRAAADDSLDDPESVRWQGEGIALLRSFLERHPDSFARGDMRFRLADLLLVQARREFREAMARYVEDQARGGSGHVALPVLSHGEALTLYRKILAEDSTFEHRDAVLFNSGMILADEGSSEAGRFFADLVAHHPDSPYSQEAWLRMGDMQFNEKRYVESVPLYQHAAGGADASLTAIALYKMGWAHYNGDRFAEAADAFRGVLDLYASDRRRQIQVDIEGEAEAYLVHSLAGAGGAKAFAAYFDRIGRRPYEVRVLMAMGQQYRRLGRFGEATAADEMVIRRYPQSPEALLGAQRLIETRQRSEKPAEVREARLAYAPTFAPGSPWYTAQTSDSVRAAGAAFARSSWESVAREHHRKARETGSREDWRAALDLYEKVLTQWPGGPEEPAIELQAGEAAAQIGRYDVALRHYGAAALSGPDSVTTQALWQRVAVTDAWYESTRDGATAPGQSKSGRSGIGRDSLARAEMVAADELLARYPDHPHGAEIAWRQGNLAFAHGWYEDAAGRFARMAARYPADPRAPRAAILTADAWFKLGRFDQAGGAYESALTTARRAGVDSLARRASQAIPIAWYRNAEAAVAADSSAHAHHAELFEQVASRWPDFEHAPLAQYRAGLAWLEAGKNAEAVRAMETLVAHFPKSEFVRDAHLQIARAWESAGEREKSASAYARFAERFPADTSAANATLHAADLYSATGMTQRADELRLGYVQKHPGDFETAMDVLEPLARRDLATVGPQHPISALLGAESPAKAPRGRRALAAKPATTAAHSYLSDYLKIAAAHPDLASKGLLAQVRFERGEEAYFASDSLPLRQPLPASIAARQKRVDQTLALYRQCVDVGVAEWSHAATFRIGRTLVAFGEALERSDRPADLQGDALRAYEDVLRERSLAISDRGEAVWADLLRGQAEKPADIWIARARDSLWPRLGSRFFFRPEMEFPAMAAEPARRIHVEKEPGDRPAKHARRNAPETPTVSQREGSDR